MVCVSSTQVTGYLVFVNVITGIGAIVPPLTVLPSKARSEAMQLLQTTTKVIKHGPQSSALLCCAEHKL